MKDTGPSAATVALVWARDQGRCARCGRHLDWDDRGRGWSVQHREPRGMGGAKHRPWVNLAANLVLLCGSGTTECHGWVESNREESLRLGWLVSRHGILRPEDVPIPHMIHGLVLLNDSGDAVPVGFVAAWEQGADS